VIKLGYNTNGFAFHRLDDAVRIIADLGYEGVALTPDVMHLDPFRATAREIGAFCGLLERLGLDVVVETGARFILDPARKHHPTLLSRDSFAGRQDFLARCIDLAAELGAPLVSIWSGRDEDEADGVEAKIALLRERLMPVLEHGEGKGIRVAFEPEPGMFIEGMELYRKLDSAMGEARIGLTLDVGHAGITESEPPHEVLEEWGEKVINIHIDDVRGGRHIHLPPGEGEIAFEPIFRVLDQWKHDFFLSVELPRHGHDAVGQARRAREFLVRAMSATQ